MATISWADRADAVLAPVFQGLARDADDPTIATAVREAYPFGERAHHPYKAWLSRVRAWKEARAAWMRAGMDPAKLDLRPLALREVRR